MEPLVSKLKSYWVTEGSLLELVSLAVQLVETDTLIGPEKLKLVQTAVAQVINDSELSAERKAALLIQAELTEQMVELVLGLLKQFGCQSKCWPGTKKLPFPVID